MGFYTLFATAFGTCSIAWTTAAVTATRLPEREEASLRALARLVGQAMARNPLPIIVPCHRVLGSGGAMTGFSAEGGVDLKRRLLALEGAPEAGFAF
jgi:O-6-methylguanine DNA methyltransferase